MSEKLKIKLSLKVLILHLREGCTQNCVSTTVLHSNSVALCSENNIPYMGI